MPGEHSKIIPNHCPWPYYRFVSLVTHGSLDRCLKEVTVGPSKDQTMDVSILKNKKITEIENSRTTTYVIPSTPL
jgi:hypothetical protein